MQDLSRFEDLDDDVVVLDTDYGQADLAGYAQPVRADHGHASRADFVWPDMQSVRVQTHMMAKRCFDIVFAGLGLFALAPLLIIVAIAIKVTSPGPVFFRQEREGYLGKSFTVFKFRSMRIDAGDPTGVEQTKKYDQRVTNVGRFIRRTSIDELPQLINVLLGQMSIVGPRPHVPNMRAGGMLYQELIPYYPHRLRMPPGLTGWAQANGLRGPTDDARVARARVDHDLYYISNFSFWFDVKIVLQTMQKEFLSGSGH